MNTQLELPAKAKPSPLNQALQVASDLLVPKTPLDVALSLFPTGKGLAAVSKGLKHLSKPAATHLLKIWNTTGKVSGFDIPKGLSKEASEEAWGFIKKLRDSHKGGQYRDPRMSHFRQPGFQAVENKAASIEAIKQGRNPLLEALDKLSTTSKGLPAKAPTNLQGQIMEKKLQKDMQLRKALDEAFDPWKD